MSLSRPPPPVVGKVNHYSIELFWNDPLDKAKEEAGGKELVKVSLQEQDRHNQWGNVYTGYAHSHTVTGADPQTTYKYRIRFMTSNENTEWSPHLTVSTTKEPLNGDHLHRAIIREDHMEIERILDTGDVPIDVPDKYGFTGLMQASQKGYTDIMEILIRHGADVNAQNDSGKTALMLACYAGQFEAVKLLRDQGAKYDDFDRGGSTPIHWAVDGGNIRLLEWIIKDGADANMRDHSHGWTPLIRCASLSGNRSVALTLLLAGAEMNVQDKDGKTALMVAIINGHQDLVELLLQRNADITVKNLYGKTAYEMAHSMERRKIARTIEDYVQSKGIKMKGAILA
ncbi:fibronectin type 3 and ankyrin repeat domains protein 1-like isoform X2 [Ostrea edulis]|uniref:fibronectin type 3 and ankyrin repeat domains protein 1-like isoform X2 n=1 Tax=Ostrea edulis TaxID=37623 RepID=UPI0024AFA383|nr:fibronectin type 3 and ankyrin repeat domains protein 1-like isoform X2 [Ostrea edulis]